MNGKIYRFIFVETKFRSRFIVLLIALVISLSEIAALVAIDRKIAQAEARKTLIVRVSEMERILYPKAHREQTIIRQSNEPIVIGDKKYFLKGVQELKGGLSALINDDVYQKDDMIQDFRIAKITIDSVLFKNVKTGEFRILRFGY